MRCAALRACSQLVPPAASLTVPCPPCTPATADADGNVCALDGLANPDNLSYFPDIDQLLIAEDTSRKLNDVAWAVDLSSGSMTRIFTVPYGSEVSAACRALATHPPACSRSRARLLRRSHPSTPTQTSAALVTSWLLCSTRTARVSAWLDGARADAGPLTCRPWNPARSQATRTALLKQLSTR